MKNQLYRYVPLLCALPFSTVESRNLFAAPAAPNQPSDPPNVTFDTSDLSWMDSRGIGYIIASTPQPPPPGSPASQHDFHVLLSAQRDRTPADEKNAREDETFDLATMARVIGPDFTAKNYPVSYAFLEKVVRDLTVLNLMLQDRNKRPSPSEAHPEIKSLYSNHGPDYPSSRAALSRTLTFVLIELFNDKARQLLARDLELEKHLLAAGANYPSDIVAGRQVAQALLFVIHDTPQFQNDIGKAKLEIRRAKASPTAGT